MTRHVWDVNAAYLSADMKKDTYLRVPPAVAAGMAAVKEAKTKNPDCDLPEMAQLYVDRYHSKSTGYSFPLDMPQIFKVDKALYGYRESGRFFNDLINKVLDKGDGALADTVTPLSVQDAEFHYPTRDFTKNNGSTPLSLCLPYLEMRVPLPLWV
jgi:hypothetical protein